MSVRFLVREGVRRVPPSLDIPVYEHDLRAAGVASRVMRVAARVEGRRRRRQGEGGGRKGGEEGEQEGAAATREEMEHQTRRLI